MLTKRNVWHLNLLPTALHKFCIDFKISTIQPKKLSSKEPHLDKIIKDISTETATTLVPEFKLHLITPQCKLWTSPPEDCPIADPYWAFFWPGGQALCRYILDNPKICENKNILDIGSGSGALSIAAALCNANTVVANDIDPIAQLATSMNMSLNRELGLLSETINLNSTDILPEAADAPLNGYLMLQELYCSKLENRPLFDVILVGDMCYDETMTTRLGLLLKAIQTINPDASILLGDPGRHCSAFITQQADTIQEYSLPNMDDFSWGFASACVYLLKA